ncbi:MAG: 5-formyltetrahydrofolate cyclo-ligase [Bacilli bacterium]|nr:5-formyltetrahydrofolate cyclo-ligase [Bacilli bacterium]
MKEEIRKEAMLMRKRIPHKQEKSEKIFQKIIQQERYQKAKGIALYKSLENEVSTDLLIDYSLSVGKRVYLPRVEDDHLSFYQIDSSTVYEKSSFSIEEPVPNENIMKENDVDFIIVPGVLFDSLNHRMGYGGGYYDRFLQNKKIYKIGVCFQEQQKEFIPVTKYDVMMDEVVTD